MDLAGRMPSGEPLAQMPRLRGLRLARGEERDQLEQREGLPHDALEARLAYAELGAHRRGFVVLELGEL